ncbi:arginine--tRNA ligase [Caminibacter mediatlanticus TB-2]|uniref:Arginine--tRNA ligase n=1 Tax=Caminibacter mediatlanticus TB-2 TaxID=391592 RepID=A0ABX5V8D3_9BACT|nr:arginine--tRNA ligase [Caminibacter mediatlanticus]QCT94219.1 arginine--tRNA ligase [Caminibacter mediatlanticus TB-2]
MKKRVSEILKKHLGENPPINKPKQKEFGHYAVPIFKYAKENKQNPIEFAKNLCEKLKCDEFESVEPLSGFVNIRLSDKFLDDFANRVLEEKENFAKDEKKESILLEYISANPTGPLHIGHARGAIFGDALTRIGRHIGYKITTEYYVNDAGRQINLLGLSVYLAAREILGLNVVWPDEYYKGEYIKDLAKDAIEEFGEDYFKKEVEIIQKDGKKEAEFNDDKLSLWAKDKMLEEIKKDIKALNVTPFDNWVSERSLYKYWDEVRSILEKNNALYEKDGKFWLKSSEYKDEKDRVVVREDGRPTYLAGDIIYHWDKFKRGYDRYINIWGADHHGYIARVKAAIKFLGFDENKLEILLSQMVKLLKGGEPYKMSKRAGNFILVRDVVEDVGGDALRFVFLTKKADTHLEFDVDDLNKEDSSNPNYYVNYAHARIRSIFRNKNIDYDDVKNIELKNLNEDEKELLFLALQLPYVLEDAFSNREPHRLTNFLIDLASEFHKFYNKNKVIGSEKEEIRLKILAVVGSILKLGLSLLGITAKERM